MRTLTATLLAKQKQAHYTGLVICELSYDGTTTDFDKTRVISIEHEDTAWSQTASVVLDNADKYFNSHDFKGWQASLFYGMVTGAGNEYMITPPMTVISQENVSREGQLVTVLGCAGIPNMLSQDIARGDHVHEADNTETIKDIINDILTSSMGAFAFCPAYTVTWDSEDALIDSVVLGRSFSVNDKDNRLEVVKKLLYYTNCVMRFAHDGQIHILNPTTSGVVYDYEYTLSAGAHKFFAKTFRSRLVVPNYIYVSSPRDSSLGYFGHAEDPGYSIKPVIKHYEADVASNAQAEDLAEALLAHYQLDSESGSVQVPINIGQEVWDYVNITDSRASDSVAGNVQTLIRRYSAFDGILNMTIRFGNAQGVLNTFLADSGSSTSPRTTSTSTSEKIAQLAACFDTLADQVLQLINKLKTAWTIDFLRVIRRLLIPHGLDADKEADPKAGAIYEATDTEITWVCYTDGTWTAVGEGGNMDITQGSTTANWQSGTATSGSAGADLTTIGTAATATKIKSFWLDTNAIATGSNITVRMYQKINSTERIIYSQTFVKGWDTIGLWIVNGELVISDVLRFEVYTDQAADNGVALGWEHVTV